MSTRVARRVQSRFSLPADNSAVQLPSPLAHGNRQTQSAFQLETLRLSVKCIPLRFSGRFIDNLDDRSMLRLSCMPHSFHVPTRLSALVSLARSICSYQTGRWRRSEYRDQGRCVGISLSVLFQFFNLMIFEVFLLGRRTLRD